MITVKEILVLLLALLVLSFSNAFTNTGNFINSLLIFSIILIIYITAKKLTAYYYEAEEETKIWTLQRYGLYERSKFKYPIPIGIILSFLLSILTFGYVKWFAVTESDVKPSITRAARRHQIYSFSEMTEWHLALISAAGIASSLALSLVAYILNFPELTKASIYFACFNLLPIGKLDGTRVFFGSIVLWATLASISLIALAYALLLI